VGAVEATTDADDDLGLADGAQPLLESGDLDVVRLVAVEGESLLVVGDEGEAVDLAEQADVAGGRVELELVRSASVRRLSSKVPCRWRS
jgi:hypothetical protein